MKLTIPSMIPKSLRRGLGCNCEDFTFEIRDGKHSIMTPPIDINHLLEGREGNVQASFILEYEYTKDSNSITLSSGGYSGKDANRIVINAEKGNHEMVSRNNSRNSEFTRIVSQNLSKLIFDISTQVIENAVSQGLSVLERWDLPDLPGDLANIKHVFRNGLFLEPYAEGNDYLDDDIILPLSSTFQGIRHVAPYDGFRNVVGTTSDKVPFQAGSFLALWRVAASTYDTAIGTVFAQDHTCLAMYHNQPQQNIVGGHVVFGTQNGIIPNGGQCHIVPLCALHNHVSNNHQMNANRQTIAVAIEDTIIT